MHSFLRFFSSRIGLGVMCIALLVGVGTIPAGATSAPPLAPGQGEITLTLRAPLFEVNTPKGVRLLGETDRYTSFQPEGQPLLPHRTYNLGLPPDADLTSLELVVSAAQVENLPGTFQIPLAEARIMACAPQEDLPGATCGEGSSTLPDVSASQPASAPQKTLTSLLAAAPAPRLSSLRGARQVTGVQLLPTGQMRKWRFARVDFAPFLYNAQLGRLSVVRSVTVTIRFRRDPALVTPQLLADSVLDEYAPTLLDNFNEVQALYAAGNAPASTLSTVSYLILTTHAIRTGSQLETYATFLREHGQTVLIEEVENLSGYPETSLADRIRSYLKANYAAWGLRYVLLVGNPHPETGDVPMRNMYPNRLGYPQADWRIIPTDSYYSNLTGNWDLNGNGYPGESTNIWDDLDGDFDAGGVDFTPTVFVGRIPVYNSNSNYLDLNTILKKAKAYQNIGQRQAWQNQALLPMTFWGLNYDSGVLGYLLEKDFLTPNGISSYKIFMNHDDAINNTCDQISIYAHGADVADQAVVNSWSGNPVGLMVWAGHGAPSGTWPGWGNNTTDCWMPYALFNTQQTAALDDTHPAFTFHNSCINGMPEDPNNVAYRLLRQGAVAVVAASRNTWLDFYGDTEPEMPTNTSSGAGIGYTYVKNLMLGLTAGESLMWSRALAPMISYFDFDNQFDFNLYGDPLSVFFVPPIPWPITLPPATPSGLTAEPPDANGHQLFKLHWTDNSTNEEYFRVTMSPITPGADILVGVGRNATAASVVSSAACGKTYNVWVRAINRDLVSAASNTVVIAADPCPPAAPSDLAAALVNNKVVLTWTDNSNNEAGFNILRWVNATTATLVGQVGPGVTTFTHDAAPCHQNLIYVITAFNVTAAAYSGNVYILSGICPPAIPVLSAGAFTETAIGLNWAHPSDASNAEDGFEVWSKPAGGTWLKLTTLPADTNHYNDQNVFCSKAYTHKVVAFNAGGRTESAELATHTAVCTPPSAPSELTVSGNYFFKTDIRLNWVDNSTNEYGFTIERETSPGVWGSAVNVSANGTSIHVTVPDCGTSYNFRIHAYNTFASSYAFATGSTAVCDSSSPIHFGALAISQTQIDLSWSPADGRTPVGYNLIRSVGLSRTQNWEPLADVAEPIHTYSNTGLLCGTTYYYSVRSVFSTQPSPSLYVTPISKATLPCVPGAPTVLSAVPVSQNGIVLSWLPPAGADPDGYYLERAPESIGVWTRIATLDADTTSYEDNALACGTGYVYRVQAYNAGGSGAFSAQDSGATYACTPAAPSGLVTSEIQKTTIILTWIDTSNNETGFALERSGDGGATWFNAGNTPTNVAVFTDSGLTCGTPYAYRVSAYGSGGQSAPSSGLATFSLPCDPFFNALPGPEGLVTVLWADSGQATTTNYVVQRALSGGVPEVIAEVAPDQNTYLDLGITCGLTYEYYLVVVNASGASAWPTPVIVNAICKPSTVVTLSASAPTLRSITLDWTAPEGGQDSYVVTRSLDGSDNWVDVEMVRMGVYTFIDTGLVPGTRYFYRVMAVNTGGEVISNMVSAITLRAIMLPVILK